MPGLGPLFTSDRFEQYARAVLRTQILLRVRSRADAAMRAQVKYDTAVAQRDDAIRRASEEGFSLRAIAETCDLSHEQIRRIVNAG